MGLIAQSWKDSGLLRGGGVVATVMSNLGLARFLEGQGLALYRTPVVVWSEKTRWPDCSPPKLQSRARISSTT